MKIKFMYINFLLIILKRSLLNIIKTVLRTFIVKTKRNRFNFMSHLHE
jgi:hypothetical protein